MALAGIAIAAPADLEKRKWGAYSAKNSMNMSMTMFRFPCWNALKVSNFSWLQALAEVTAARWLEDTAPEPAAPPAARRTATPPGITSAWRRTARRWEIRWRGRQTASREDGIIVVRKG
jgi:hypothetical protein